MQAKPVRLIYLFIFSRWNHWGEDAHVLPGSGLERPPEAESWIHTSTRDWGGHQLLWQYVADQLDFWTDTNSAMCHDLAWTCLTAIRMWISVCTRTQTNLDTPLLETQEDTLLWEQAVSVDDNFRVMPGGNFREDNLSFLRFNSLSLRFLQPDQSATVTWAQMTMMKPTMMNHLWSCDSSPPWPTVSARYLLLLCSLVFTYSICHVIKRYIQR